MAEPIVNPEIPYNGEIPAGLELGRMCRLQGITLPDADRFNINFQVGPNAKPRDDTALHISVRLNQGYIARNSYEDGSWGNEQDSGSLPIGQAQSWEILILIDHNDYKVAINGQHFCEFPHRIPFSKVSHLLIDGDVKITLISWEGIAGVVGGESATKASELNAEGPQGAPMGAPPQQFGYGPPGGFGPAPGGYGPPPGAYGPPPGAYGAPPVPPGHQEQSGFNSFLEQAQSMLTGAIANGAAQKLLGGLLSGGGQQQGQGYAPQNAKYGIYPDLPQDLNVDQKGNQNIQQPGPVESLLTRFLSGGNDQQHTQTTVGNQQNVPSQSGQSLDIGSLLSGLLSNKQQAPTQQGAQPPNNPDAQQNQSVDITSLLSGFLSGGKQQGGQDSTGSQQNPSTNQQSQGIDINNLISGLLASTRQQPELQTTGQGPPGQTNVPNQQPHGVDFGSILSGLLSGGNQQPAHTGAPPHTLPQPPYVLPQQNVPGNQQSQGIDIGSLLGGLLSGGNQNAQAGQAPPMNHPQQPNQQSQGGIDLSSLLSGLLSGGDGSKQPAGGTYRPQPTGGNFGPQPQSPQPPSSGNFGPQPASTANFGPQPPNTGNFGPQPPTVQNYGPGQPQSGGNAPQVPQIPSQPSKPAAQADIEDVSDLLADEIARESTRTQQHASPSQQQYGHYPHPQQQQQQGGPIEGLLSGLLSGGGGSQQHQPQGNVGNLGSVGGLLSSFFNTKDNNRPSY